MRWLLLSVIQMVPSEATAHPCGLPNPASRACSAGAVSAKSSGGDGVDETAGAFDVSDGMFPVSVTVAA